MVDVDVEVMEQKPIAMSGVRHMLDETKKNGKELNFRAEKVHVYLSEFTKLNKKEVDSLYEKIKSLNISKLRDRHIIKIIDLMPTDPESLKIIFSGEALSLKQEEINQILEAISSK
ncbi:hypothetical protein J4440_01505 [Candidatus Woesearchaeota archaeon]|nr:hypothetical protein [Candidatus Woesearchaeota archaeon]